MSDGRNRMDRFGQQPPKPGDFVQYEVVKLMKGKRGALAYLPALGKKDRAAQKRWESQPELLEIAKGFAAGPDPEGHEDLAERVRKLVEDIEGRSPDGKRDYAITVVSGTSYDCSVTTDKGLEEAKRLCEGAVCDKINGEQHDEFDDADVIESDVTTVATGVA